MIIDKNKRYLFVCTFAQSRSTYFAERLMEQGIKSLFCGYDTTSDIKLNTNLMKWADVIILLDKDIKYNKFMSQIDFYCSNSDTDLIEFFIEDEPFMFNDYYNKLINKNE